MYVKKAVILNRSGLHARPAADFIKAAKAFDSKVQISRTDRPGSAVNAKSMLLLLSLSIGCGTEVEISADGSDEAAAVGALTALIETRFGEA